MVEIDDHAGPTCGALSPGAARDGRRVRCDRAAGHTGLHHHAAAAVRAYWTPTHEAADGSPAPRRPDDAMTEVARLEVDLVHLRTIAVATGVLMAARGLTADEAADALRYAAVTSGQALHDVAAAVIRTGDLPGAGRP